MNILKKREELYYVIDGANGQRSPLIMCESHNELADWLAETEIPEDHFIFHVGECDEAEAIIWANTALIHVNTFIENFKTKKEVH